MKMHLLTGMLAVVVIGSALPAPSCRSPRRFLATVAGGASPVFVWKGETVELVCRPASEVGCRWTSESGNILTDDCQLTTSNTGVFKCQQGGQMIGSVMLQEKAFYRYGNNRQQSYNRQNNHMCSDTGKVIEKHLLCDGRRHCDNGEDEADCGLPCGAPAAAPGSTLAAPVRQLYPHGAQVSYTCRRGAAFRQTLGAYRRTCHEGRWSDSPPECQRNLAFGRPSAASVRPVLGLGAELAVDGELSTWTMLTPAVSAQSLNVTLAANASVDLVLVRTLSPRYEVALLTAEERTVCTCKGNVTDAPELAGLAACTCPVSSAAAGGGGGPVAVEILSSGGALMSLSVAEVAAFEAPSPVTDECALLDRPAHGRFERAGAAGVRLVCEAGYRASCGGELPCGEAAAAVCRPVTCPPPPAIPRAVILSSNGSGWSAVTEYGCAAGYQLYPPQQRTRSDCRDGLWTISHLSCLPESDLRVVALRLGQQHERSMAALSEELETVLYWQQQLLEQTQRRLQRLEQMLGLPWEEVKQADTVEQEEEEEREIEEEIVEEIVEEMEEEEERDEEEEREEEEESEIDEEIEEMEEEEERDEEEEREEEESEIDVEIEEEMEEDYEEEEYEIMK